MQKKENIVDRILEIILIVIILFFIRKGSERYFVAFLFSIIILLKNIHNKRNNCINKKMILFYGMYSFFLLLSMDKNTIEVFSVFRLILCNFFFFWCLLQAEIKEKIYNEILGVITILSLISSYRGFREWRIHSFSSNYRIIKAGYPTIYTIEIGVYIFVSLFCCIKAKNISLKIISGMIFLFSCFVLIGTHSRVTLILVPLLLLGLGGYYLVKNKKINYKYLFVIMVVGILSLNTPFFKQHAKRLSSINNFEKIKNDIRMKIYIKGWRDFRNNDFRCLGYKYYNNHDLEAVSWEKTKHLHNNILEIMVTQGIGALVFYIFYNIYLFKLLLKRLKENITEEQKNMTKLSIVLFIFINLAGLVDSNIYFYKINLIISLIYGLSFCNIIKDNESLK
ncbi:MAG: O-antigen ligase family protein [Fusobacterium varium]|uniref:O-antigen ligase family protein n=1 Tax=Fusobacterium varium TaxID=856 RepID=UPI00242CC09E|nr:O-antigen ligase family protein [Fusobacterium varium]UYI79836.1 MAG: O-antigen ligase family protein [Fusobacterium varium]